MIKTNTSSDKILISNLHIKLTKVNIGPKNALNMSSINFVNLHISTVQNMFLFGLT